MRRRSISILLALVLIFSFTFASGAASSKEVYVVSKVSAEAEGVSAAVRLTYDKYGLIKKGVLKDANGLFKVVSNFSYNKKYRITANESTSYYFGNAAGTVKTRFTTNSKGYITKILSYDEKGKLTGSVKITYNKKNQVTKERVYDKNGKLTTTTKYTRKNGKVTAAKTYTDKGKLKSRDKYTYDGNTTTVRQYNSSGELEATTVIRTKNGRMSSVRQYDETKNHKLTANAKFSYKKIKTTKKKLVNAQQESINALL